MNKHTRSVSLIDGHTEEITDAEIKKALECCKVEFENCEKCPYGGIDCLNEKGESLVMRDALDLINRLQAKNKELDEKLIIQKGLIDTQQAEIEKLNVELVGMRGACESYKMHYDNAQAEIEELRKTNYMDSDSFVSYKAKLDYLNKHQKEVESLKAEIERLERILDARCDVCPSVTTAIKEFAERLKAKIRKDIDEQGMLPLPYTKKAYDTVGVFIDNLVKKMTEVKENG